MSFLSQLSDKVYSLTTDELDEAVTLWQYKQVLPEIRDYLEYYIEHDFAVQIKTAGRGTDCEFNAANVSAELLDEIAAAATEIYIFHVAVTEPNPMAMRRDIAKAVWGPNAEGGTYADIICRELGITKED